MLEKLLKVTQMAVIISLILTFYAKLFVVQVKLNYIKNIFHAGLIIKTKYFKISEICKLKIIKFVLLFLVLISFTFDYHS
jgi:hypothetical protein